MLSKPSEKKSAAVKQLRKDDLTVTVKAGEQIETLATSLEEAQKEFDALKKEKDVAMQGLGKLRECKMVLSTSKMVWKISCSVPSGCVRSMQTLSTVRKAVLTSCKDW